MEFGYEPCTLDLAVEERSEPSLLLSFHENSFISVIQCRYFLQDCLILVDFNYLQSQYFYTPLIPQ